MRLTGTVECARWSERRVQAMGSPAIVIAGEADDPALDWAEAELARLERCWSRFDTTSELSALNASGGDWFQMSGTLGSAVDRTIRLHELTGGSFDPTIHRQLIAAGYDRPFRSLVRDQDEPAPRWEAAPGIAGIERDGDRIRLPVGVTLDLGGVGKGLAADMLAVGLVARGAASVCVSLGGDIRVAGGVPTPGGWQIPVDDPARPGHVLGHVGVTNEAIVTSTTAFRNWRRGGEEMHHLIDPRRGAPADTDVLAVVTVAREAWLAEGYAKAALIRGSVAGRRLLDAAGLHGWLVTNDGGVLASEWAPPMKTFVGAAGRTTA